MQAMWGSAKQGRGQLLASFWHVSATVSIIRIDVRQLSMRQFQVILSTATWLCRPQA
jgi:hypothetical protein